MMLKKMINVALTLSAAFLVVVADAAMSSTSLVLHGEPNCPKELLK